MAQDTNLHYFKVTAFSAFWRYLVALTYRQREMKVSLLPQV